MEVILPEDAFHFQKKKKRQQPEARFVGVGTPAIRIPAAGMPDKPGSIRKRMATFRGGNQPGNQEK